MHKYIKYVLLFFIFLFLVSGCASTKEMRPKILEEMARLDRSYVPVLILTDLGRQAESKIAIDDYVKAWEKAYKRFAKLEIKYGLDITDKYWAEDFNKINSLIMNAKMLINEQRLDEAHNEIDEVRKIFKELRHRNGLKYIMDTLNGFHSKLEEINLIVEGGEELKESDYSYLNELFISAKTSWINLLQEDYDLEIFGFKEEKNNAIRNRVAEHEVLIRQFAGALASLSREEIAKAAEQLESNFILLYKAFGDFDLIFKKVKSQYKVSKEAVKQ